MTASAIYEGRVAHRRKGAASDAFEYRLFMPLLDLDEVSALLDRIPFWSARRPAPARFREADYLPGDGGSLAERARNLVEARLGRRPRGPVRLLANPRYLGVGFNPISLLFLHASDGNVDSVVAEVTNTPWAERTAYVLDAHHQAHHGLITCRFGKRLHVSPFQPMEQSYEISVTPPRERFAVVIRNLEGGREVFVASMALRRFDLTRGRMLGLLLRYPPMTIATLVRIYAKALRLKLRGVPFHSHPEVRADEQAVRVPELPERRRGDRVAPSARFRDHEQAAGRRRRNRSRRAAAGRRSGDGRPGRRAV